MDLWSLWWGSCGPDLVRDRPKRGAGSVGQRSPAPTRLKPAASPRLQKNLYSLRFPRRAAEEARAAAVTATPLPCPRPCPCSDLTTSPEPSRSPGPGSSRPLGMAGVTLCLPRHGPGTRPSRRDGVLHQGRVPSLGEGSGGSFAERRAQPEVAPSAPSPGCRPPTRPADRGGPRSHAPGCGKGQWLRYHPSPRSSRQSLRSQWGN